MTGLKDSGVKNKYLLDTNIFIDYLRDYPPIVDFFDKLINNTNFIVAISGITEYELYAGKSLDNHLVQKRVDALLNQVKIFPLSRTFMQFAGELARHNSMGIGDCLVAATALKHNYFLVTRNSRHFKDIPNLKLLVPETEI